MAQLRCQAFDELMEDKKMEGRKEGRLSIISHLLAAGMEESQILKITQCSEEEILLAAGR